ncbi:hypothetical protein V6N11_009002 [Hibiscus sabdariffa]|uniref:Uncharacterized protein n=1 Tax=Hibiscus sabdariffa TaxID=183260 RepID=A0ABR2PPD7_9ROSI
MSEVATDGVIRDSLEVFSTDDSVSRQFPFSVSTSASFNDSSSSTSFQTSPHLIIPSCTIESIPANASLVSPHGPVATCCRGHTSSTSPTMVTPNVVEPFLFDVEPSNDALQETSVLVNQHSYRPTNKLNDNP